MDEIKVKKKLWAPQAFLPDGWHQQVLLEINENGLWDNITDGIENPQEGVEILQGAIVPGLVNAHSHAFQRTFVGMTESRTASEDTFWSWREQMYQVAMNITPEQLHKVAIQLYKELLDGGYTQVCEFHYIHLDPEGKPYQDPLEMAWAMIDAAEAVGIGITMLPTLFEREGFYKDNLHTEQRRFGTNPQSVLEACDTINAAKRPLVNAGIAIHSLRTASPKSILKLVELTSDRKIPIHIHVSEQLSEVEECLSTTGYRPIEWLIAHGLLDARWNLVHATHTTPEELDGIAESGATVTICPTTEANLGDGIPDLEGMLQRRIPIAIGSDSQICRNIWEELRWLEYVQRLVKRKRNIAADPQQQWFSTADRLFAETQKGGTNTARVGPNGLVPGSRANALVLHDIKDSGIQTVTNEKHSLEKKIFAGLGVVHHI